ncbi:tyrosine-type recombinase/integrase [Devosia sp.]|uniref:tyrosine-type recombinase/integrase n=1 Tax=Devosia sp. TaxID=1871048 RepID=UPI002FC993E0
MRPRKHDRHLPSCMYQKHGAFYLVRKGKWERLGSDYTQALLEYARRTETTTAGTLPDHIDKVLKHITPKLKPSSAKAYEYAAKLLKKRLSDFNPDQVLPRHVAEIKVGMIDTPNMANRVITVLRVVYQHLVEWQVVDSNPCSDIRRHKEAERDRYLTDAEWMAIRRAATNDLRAIIDVAFLTGQRIGDVLSIRLGDISDDGITFVQQKTGAKLMVRMSPDLASSVSTAKALPRKARSLYLFCSPHSLRPYAYDTVRKAWMAACNKAGVADAHLHDIRAKALTDTRRQGNDAQKLGGHSSAKMTDRYIRLREIEVAEPPRMPTATPAKKA